MNQEYVLRLANFEDYKRIFDIRNKLELGMHSLNQQIKERERWFKDTMESHLSHLLVLESSDIIGVLCFEINAFEAQVTVYVDSYYFRNGFGTITYQMGEDWLLGKYTLLKKIIALIPPYDLRGQSFFAKLGFIEVKDNIWKKEINFTG